MSRPTLRPVRLLMAGLSCLDHLWHVAHFPPTNSRTPTQGYRSQGGGPAATAAVTAARLGAYAELWALHGDDNNGAQALAELEHFGVNCSQLKQLRNSASVVSGVLVTPDGERYIFPYFPENLESHADAQNWDFSRLNGIDCLLSDARHPAMNEAVMREAKARGIPIVGDFSNTRHWQLSRYADYLLVSQECAQEVLGRDDPEAALAAIKQFDSQLVGVTLGEQGFLFEQQGRLRHIPAFEVEVVDSTGAGDVFHGAFAFAVAQRWELEYCALFASVTAALACTALGGRAGIPEVHTVQQLLEEKTSKEIDEMRWM